MFKAVKALLIAGKSGMSPSRTGVVIVVAKVLVWLSIVVLKKLGIPVSL